ncbi:putative glycerol-3-phosphate acyltransferase PlsY [Campylobacter sputorum subsp. bubulus]|uniref:Glycerol-3-phosphate acyltransferase n=1 Tax=Campylobacter sputorum subsp. sputorum TaxID=32024 RepID=A0A381DKL1_9BACT|nr:glycerol-3-phosphate 1-O-acyltransferase PlsY [Campylobacter sputorum]ASM34570.1 acyl phosphate:glycerol-3-phosphate acyltransferase [Campylobacter sputorum aubsp. sputorum RM3237]ASM36191.1 acyl phosphate:glycerol-3-phosphate acyltransferase [Campylobacter sputorum bv. faecalis CCUG 20703]ASM37871.1 acyl phosphate:glycerol-3-phosphate acyltransferase [Campylobacter sputorum bv. paraureolyticus LMG 11764]KAB0580792.1 glycerol-3-phosphate 1-O-acyltransferase PlsY [Campylobacter sputorum subsp
MNENLVAYLVAYLIGAIPFGLILCKKFTNIDIRKEGSHSIGATNVLRVLKEHGSKEAKKAAILVVVFDALKGIIPILIGKYIFDLHITTLWSMGVFAVLGHCFSPYLKFEGGKGIATGAGVFACFLPLELIGALVVWFFVGKVLKISSLASLCALLAMVLLSFIFHYDMPGINTHAPILIIAFIVTYKHIPNIKRLLSKTESKVI